jgi:hypothetical protein
MRSSSATGPSCRSSPSCTSPSSSLTAPAPRCRSWARSSRRR